MMDNTPTRDPLSRSPTLCRPCYALGALLFPLSAPDQRHQHRTRGKRLVVLLGQKKAIMIAVRNVSGRRRWSKLREWLTGPRAA